MSAFYQQDPGQWWLLPTAAISFPLKPIKEKWCWSASLWCSKSRLSAILGEKPQLRWNVSWHTFSTQTHTDTKTRSFAHLCLLLRPHWSQCQSIRITAAVLIRTQKLCNSIFILIGWQLLIVKINLVFFKFIYVYICIYIYDFIHICVCIYKYKYVCVYIHI